jgi:cytidyltransferase-like protein
MPRIGVIYGVFDLFHKGHYNVLKRAKKHCDRLWVCVLSDKSVAKYKRTPILNEQVRCGIVQECKYVDLAVITEREPRFDKGVDVFFVSEKLKYYELHCVPSHRGKDIVWLPYTEGISTTLIINNMRRKTTWEKFLSILGL